MTSESSSFFLYNTAAPYAPIMDTISVSGTYMYSNKLIMLNLNPNSIEWTLGNCHAAGQSVMHTLTYI
jgi:hypothetical protein